MSGSGCPVCRPSADSRRQTHCRLGWRLYYGWRELAITRSEVCTRQPVDRMPGELRDAYAACQAAHDRYRAHVEFNWAPDPPEEGEEGAA